MLISSRNPQRHTWMNVRPNVWAPCGPVKLVLKLTTTLLLWQLFALSSGKVELSYTWPFMHSWWSCMQLELEWRSQGRNQKGCFVRWNVFLWNSLGLVFLLPWPCQCACFKWMQEKMDKIYNYSARRAAWISLTSTLSQEIAWLKPIPNRQGEAIIKSHVSASLYLPIRRRACHKLTLPSRPAVPGVGKWMHFQETQMTTTSSTHGWSLSTSSYHFSFPRCCVER